MWKVRPNSNYTYFKLNMWKVHPNRMILGDMGARITLDMLEAA